MTTYQDSLKKACIALLDLLVINSDQCHASFGKSNSHFGSRCALRWQPTAASIVLL